MSLTRLLSTFGLMALVGMPAMSQDSLPPKVPPGDKLDKAGDPLPSGAVARLGTTRFRHQSAVSFVGYSGDGGLLITVSGEGSVRFWDRGGKEVRRLEFKVPVKRSMDGGRPSVLLSGDGNTLVFGADDGDCTVIDVATGKTLKEFKVGAVWRNPGYAQRELSHDGRFLLFVTDFGVSKISAWDTSTGKLVRETNPKEKGLSFTAATLSKDGKTLVTVERRGPDGPQIHFRDVASDRELRSPITPLDLVTELVFTADGKYLITRNHRGRPGVQQIDAATGKELRQFSEKAGLIRGMFLSPDHKSLLVVCFKQVTQYDLKSGDELRAFPVAAPPPNFNFGMDLRGNRFSLAISPEARRWPCQSSPRWRSGTCRPARR